MSGEDRAQQIRARVEAHRRDAEEVGIPLERYDAGLSVAETLALWSELDTLRGDVEAVKAERDRLRKAVEHYAADATWMKRSEALDYRDVYTPCQDGYEVARAALAGTETPRPHPPLCETCGERWPKSKVGDLCPSCQLTAPVMWGVDDRAVSERQEGE